MLSEAAAYSNRRPAVIHVLETAVINWIKQIKGILKLDPELEIAKRFGARPVPLDEIEVNIPSFLHFLFPFGAI